MFRDMPDRERPGQLRLRPMPSSAAARSTGLRLRLYPQGRRMGSPPRLPAGGAAAASAPPVRA